MSTFWYQDSVAAAVGEANTSGKLLLVCLIQDTLEGSDSDAFLSRFKDEGILAGLEDVNMIPLLLIKDSPDGAMFAQIFPILTIPALYIIRAGALADFINASVSSEEMLVRILKADAGENMIPPPPAHLVNTSPPTATPSISAVPTATLPASQPQIQPESTPAPITPSASSSAASSGGQASQADQLKKIVQERRLQKEKEEKEAAKQREIQRRAQSKDLSSAQRDLKEKEAKKIKDQIEKEKREDAAYKKRLLQQLEEDKERRRKERQKAAEEIAGTAPVPVTATPQEIRAQNTSALFSATNDSASGMHYEKTSRLNIRLLDGSSIKHEFQGTDTLDDVRRWIDDNMPEGDQGVAYNIVQLIPPRTFTDGVLRDLDLCPSATLILKAQPTSASAYNGAGGSGVVPMVVNAGWSAFGLARGLATSALGTASYYIGGGGAPTTSTPTESSPSSSSSSRNTGASKKNDSETSYNGNSTNLM